MPLLETLARLEHRLRPALHLLPPTIAIRAFSAGRTMFADRFAADVPARSIDTAPWQRPITAWGLEFRVPLWNAAGMFKKGEGYPVVSRQGAGGYVAGTTTARPRAGNVKNGVRWPSAAYPRSGAASNWMGLPNEGHAVVASRLAALQRIPGCPVGASVSADPGVPEHEALPELVQGLRDYDAARVDYIELNESCPNVPGHGAHDAVLDDGLLRRLHHVAEHFLRSRTRPLPVVVKFSTDTNPDQIPTLVHTLLEAGFDGIILGNTSVQYAAVRELIHAAERAAFDRFTQTFGGGCSGRPLRQHSLQLSALAVQVVQQARPLHEFHVIRCGGIATPEDLAASARAGIVLNQWYTGYFDRFGVHGHDVYRSMFA